MSEDLSVSVGDIPSNEPGEPSTSTGGIVAGVTIVINGLVLFGLATFTVEQKAYIIAAVSFLAPLIAGIWIRAKVYSPKTVEQITAALKLRLSDAQHATTAAKAEARANLNVANLVNQVVPSVVNAAVGGATSTRALPEVPQADLPPMGRYGRLQGQQEPYMSPPVERPQPTYAPRLQQTAQPEGFYDYSTPDPVPPAQVGPRGYSRRHARNDE